MLGPEHPDTLITINNLAVLYLSQEKYAEAEPLLKQKLEISQRVLGPEHRETFVGMSNLVYKSQGRYAEAEPLINQCFETAQQHAGSGTPGHNRDNAETPENCDQSKYTEAEPLGTQVLEISRRVLGPEHPITIRAMRNLSVLYCTQRIRRSRAALHGGTGDIAPRAGARNTRRRST